MKSYIFSFIIGICMSFPFVAHADDLELSPYIPSILIVESDDAISELESQGVIVWHRRGGMVVCAVPRTMQSANRVRGVRREERGRRCIPTMDIARQWHGSERLLSGEDLDRPYTGRGVVVGFCDTGFDPNHIAFLDENGVSRVRKLVMYDEPNGVRTLLESADEIAQWTTDEPDEYHGSHVANIMAGGYRDGLYYGMAPDAEIVATTSKLYDAGILAACEDIVDYAKSVGKPAVINLSIGSYNGPHDGTSLFCRYMDMLAEDAIVCMSAGNEGVRNNSFTAQFTDDFTVWRTRTMSSDWCQFDMDGMIDAWSRDTRPVGVSFLLRDNYTNTVYYRHPIQTGETEFSEVIDLSTIPEVKDLIEGKVYLSGYVSDLNGRWVTEVSYLTHTDIPDPSAPTGNWAHYELAFEFSGEPGVVADIFGDGITSALRQWGGYAAPNSDMSISDICTGRNVISVGMMCSRDELPTIGGEPLTRPWAVGEVWDRSSYATLSDGRTLPHTVAPGGCIISACNSYYVQKYPEQISIMQGVTQYGGKDYYWKDESGTSMSSPFTAGVIACWLEANPNLTVADVQRIIESTNSHDYPNPDDPHHGQGWLSPYEGLKLAIAESGISGVVNPESAGVVALMRNGQIEILNPSGSRVSVNIFGVSGLAPLPAFELHEPVTVLDISALAPGTYILTLSSESGVPFTLKFQR